MSWPYEANHYILWPAIAIVFFGVLGACVWRQRKAPGAIPFLFIIICSMAWALSNSLVLCATTDSARIFWHQFQLLFPIPFVTAELCFGIGYAGFERLFTRRNIALLAVVPVLYTVVLITNESHHLAWTNIWYDGYTFFNRGPGTLGAIGYCYLLSFLNLVILTRLSIRSPRHRWIAAGLMVALVCSRGAALLNVLDWNPFAPVNPLTVISRVNILCYAVAFFRFRMFEVVPLARDMVMERMSDAMIVLDIEDRIADINLPAKNLFSVSRPKVLGKQIDDVMQTYQDLLSLVRSPGQKQGDICFNEVYGRWFQVSVSPLIDRRGFRLGRILWFHDITEEREARLKILNQQQTLAMLQEREFLARELHDGIGQMLAAVDMQASSAGTLLARGELEGAASCLDSISATTRQGKVFIRDYLFGVKIGPTGEQGLIESLSRYISHYNREFDVPVDLTVPPGTTTRLDSASRVQLQLIIQEALTNIRKHSNASSGQVIFHGCKDELCVTIEDNGKGLDPLDIEKKEGFGFRSMRGRAKAIDATFDVIAAVGEGTRLTIRVPYKKETS